MSKAIQSYYDWELSFKNKSKSDKNLKKDDFNSLGISDYSFKDFMKKWKEKNFS
ncbi:MAG: hypothetical protein ACFE75_07750 [Candidatus Hodarchaeota archaeon]